MIWNPRRAATVCASTLGLLMLGMTPAVAHVTVHTDDGVQGASDAAVMFRTPDEEDHAATVKLQVFFPRAHPLLDVLVEPHQGWHSTTKIATLAHPVTTDDGKITKAVSEVTWTADSTADGLQPGEGDDFVVTAGQLPDTASITFRALQTYSDGDVVKWIESQAPGAPEPDHPAPVLRLEPPSTSNSNGATNGSTAPSVTASSSASSSSDAIARGLAIAALVVAVIAAALAGRGLRRPG